jgi:LAO/AO transport system kinase
VIVESVGLGQSEVDIDAAVDMMILLVPPGGGDGLQASKKGIMEAADLIIVNKADGNLLATAKHTKADYSGAMMFVRRKHVHWGPKVLMISAHTGDNVDQVEEDIAAFHKLMCDNGHLVEKRATQARQWMRSHFQRALVAEFENNPIMQLHVQEFTRQLDGGLTTPRAAAERLLESIHYDVKR